MLETQGFDPKIINSQALVLLHPEWSTCKKALTRMVTRESEDRKASREHSGEMSDQPLTASHLDPLSIEPKDNSRRLAYFWVLPGLWQFAAAKYSSGFALFMSTTGMAYLGAGMVIFPGASVMIGFLLLLLGTITFLLISLAHLVKWQPARQDSGFPLLLTVLFPGLGHLVVTRKTYGVFFIAIGLILLAAGFEFAFYFLKTLAILALPQFLGSRIAPATVYLLSRLIIWAGSLSPVFLYPGQGPSMAPTLEEGDLAIVRLCGDLDCIEKGDIVVLRPEALGFSGIQGRIGKRVAALPGDSIPTLEDWSDWLNVQAPQTISEHAASSIGQTETAGYLPSVVPEGFMYVLGDHLSQSTDSRHFGLVPEDALEGIVYKVWKPPDAIRKKVGELAAAPE